MPKRKTTTPRPRYSGQKVPTAIQKMVAKKLMAGIKNPMKQKNKMDLLPWVMKFRRFDGQPPSMPNFLVDIYNDRHPEIVFMKAAQVGISEWGVNETLWVADQRWGNRGVGLYVFPKQEQMDDFSQARVAKAIDDSYYLKERVKALDKIANRVRLRKLNGTPIYYRGSDSVMQIRSIDADIVVCDEVDLFREGSVDKAKERLGSAEMPLFRAFSQPQYPKGPIDELYASSDQRYYYIPCEHCNTKQRLTWDENVEFSLDLKDVRVICKKCKKPINRLGEGEWIAYEQGNYAHGYQISKLYSPRANLPSMVRKFVNQADPETVQSFWNADMGIPHRPEGTPGLESFKREVYEWMTRYPQQAMGIDVGRKLHCAMIGRTDPSEPWRLTYIEAPLHFLPDPKRPKEVSLEERWLQYLPDNTIIDAGGDPRATAEWAKLHRGKVRLWQHRPSAIKPEYTEDGFVNMHRTSLLDLLYSTLKSHAVILHAHAASADGDFWDHLEANVKELVMVQDREVLRYSPKSADHYAFALAFAILAAGLRPSGGQIQIVPKTVPKAISGDEDMVAVRTMGQSVSGYGMGRWTGNLGPGKWGRWR